MVAVGRIVKDHLEIKDMDWDTFHTLLANTWQYNAAIEDLEWSYPDGVLSWVGDTMTLQAALEVMTSNGKGYPTFWISRREPDIGGIVRLVSPSPTISHTRLISASLRHSGEAPAGGVKDNAMVQVGMRSEFPFQKDFVHLDRSEFVEGRAKSHNIAEETTSASKSTSRRDSAPRKFPALSIDYPQSKEKFTQPKEKAGSCLAQREDGLWVRLVCPKCQKGNFLSAHGFISHCRIVHKIKLRNTNEAAIVCGQPIEICELGGVETAACPSKLSTHEDPGQAYLSLPNHAADVPILSDDEPDESTIRVDTGSRGETEVKHAEPIPKPRRRFTIKIHKEAAVTDPQPIEIDEVSGIDTIDEPVISTIRANTRSRKDSEPQPAKLSSGLKRKYTVSVEIPARKRSFFWPNHMTQPSCIRSYTALWQQRLHSIYSLFWLDDPSDPSMAV